MTDYIELATTTAFSFLRGASHPEEHVRAAQDLGHGGIGIADRNTLAGVVRAHAQARALDFPLRVGARLAFCDDTPDLLAYPIDRAAYGRLCRLLTAGNMRARKGECQLTRTDLLDWQEGLCLAVLPPRRLPDDFGEVVETLKAAAGDRLWLAATRPYAGDDTRRLARLRAFSAHMRVPLLAVGDVLYHSPERRSLQDVLTCIRTQTTLEAAGRRLQANGERHLKSPAEMARLFRAVPEALDQTRAFADRLAFSLEDLKPSYPREVREGFATPQEALAALACAGAARRYPQGVPPKVRQALDHELALIDQLHYAPYFLTVHEIVRFARDRGILCQGRGSAANSAVCFCLGLTEVDPMRSTLVFERFISAERDEPPDIDVDFEHERRGEVLQFIYDRYGAAHAGLAATTISYRTRSAVREVGRVFGLSRDTVGALAGSVWGWSSAGVSGSQAARLGFDPADPHLAATLTLARDLIGMPRHLSQHVGGMVVTHDRLDETVPLTRSAMAERPILEWNKDDLEQVGLLKVDILALGMLSAIRRCFDLLGAHYGLPLARIGAVPQEDPRVYAMLRRADSVGVFQVESRAQQTMLPRLRPERFEDLVVEVAIVRPGPIQGGMVHPYLRRRQGLETVSYPSQALRQVLEPTLGIPLFQEQAMQIAMVGAGFSAGEADRLRRAMATFKRVGTMEGFHSRLIGGMVANGYTPAFAESLWAQIKGFGSYGFPRAHAESFALLVYCSAWIKCHYPDVFLVGLMNSWPMGFYAPAQLARDAREHGVALRPVDVNASAWDHGLEPETDRAAARLAARHQDMAADVRTTHAVRLGLRQVEGLRAQDGLMIAAARGNGYDSVRDLWLRTGLPVSTLERLADADAFRSLGLDRRAALWAVRGLNRAGDADDLPLFRAAAATREPRMDLPVLPPGGQVVADYRHLKLSLKAHPLSFLRARLEARGVTACARLPDLANGRRLTLAGLVLVRQRPGTASGVIFMTLEDEGAWANVIVWPNVFEAFRAQVMGARLVGVHGRLQKASGVVHVVADRIEDWSALLAELDQTGAAEAAMPQGRNFH